MEGRGVVLLERESEVGRVEALCADARDGHGRLLLVEGPAGIGKTSLLAAARRIAPDHGLRPLRARGSQMEQEFPFGIARQLLEPVLLRADGEEREALLDGAAALAERALSTDVSAAASATADPGFSVLHGLYWLTANIAAREPLLILVDDCHWADLPSLRYLAFLLPRLGELPVGVIAATRGAGTGGPEPAQRELLDAFTRDPDTEVVRPEPLGAEGVAALLELRLGEEGIAKGLPGELHRVTGGLPFLVSQAVSALRDQSATGAAPGASGPTRGRDGGRGRRLSLADSLAVDSTVSRAVRARLANLSGSAEPLAAAVAVLEQASLREAAELAGIDVEDAGRAADQLAAAEIFEAGRPLRFAHALVRASIHTSLPGTRRDALHRRAAELLEAQAGSGGDGPAGDAPASAGPVEDRIAQHLLVVEPIGDQTIVARLTKAADAALARGAPESAAAYLRRALQEPPPPEDRGSVLYALGVAEGRSGQLDVAVEHLEAALEAATEPADQVRITIALAYQHARMRRARAAVEIADRTLERLGRDDPLRLALEGVAVGIGVTDGSSMAVVADRAEGLLAAVSRCSGDVPRVVPAGLALLKAYRGEVEEAVALAERALNGGPAVWNHPSQPSNYLFSAAALMFAGTDAQAAGHVEDGIRVGRSTGDVPIFALSMANRALLALRRGDTSSAEADARASLDSMGQTTTGIARHVATAALIEAQLERGDVTGAAATFAACGLDDRDQSLPGVLLRHAQGRLLLVRRQYTDAIAVLEAVGRTCEALTATNPQVAPWRSDLALARSQGEVGPPAEAVALADAEVADARRVGLPGPLGTALRVAGLVRGGGKAGLPFLRDAVEVLRGADARLLEAKANVDLGGALRRANEREAARVPLRHGLELARACGARPLAELALTELKASGARARSAVYSGADSLTPSERRVAEMAAQGMTNRQIAQDLFVTANTVETHLTSVYRKLDCPERSKLSAYLGKAGAGAA